MCQSGLKVEVLFSLHNCICRVFSIKYKGLVHFAKKNLQTAEN